MLEVMLVSLDDHVCLNSKELIEVNKIRALHTYRISTHTPQNRNGDFSTKLDVFNYMKPQLSRSLYKLVIGFRMRQGSFSDRKLVIISCPQEVGSVGSPGSVALYRLGNKMENVRFKWQTEQVAEKNSVKVISWYLTEHKALVISIN